MSRMSWQTSRRGTPASVAAFRARSSSVSLKSTPVTWKPRRASSIEWRPNPHGASRIRAPASSAATPTIHSTSLAASVGDANACEIWGQASRKNRSLWNTGDVVAGTARAVYSVGGLRRRATRRCCNGVRKLGASRGWPEPGSTRRCCNGVRKLGASRGWPEPGTTRLRAACDIFRLMATLVTGAFGCIGSWVVRGLLAGGERPVVFDVGDDPWRPRMIAGDDVARRITIVRGDIADRDALVRVVRHHAIRRIIHLAAWQVPLCRQDPSRGALVNVVGTANVFEAARASEGRVERVVYASSAAVFGAPDLYPPGPIKDDAPRLPATHYGVYKVANEETARVYWEEHRLSSMGFRPLSVYGPGRDFGVTADPTLAMKSAVLGRAFKFRWGGRTDLVYVEDVARALLAAAASRLDGARVYNLHGASVAIAELVRMIEAAWPRAQGLITHVEQPIPFPAALDDARYQKDLGPAPPTALADGLRKTLDEFARLQTEGRLDARELG